MTVRTHYAAGTVISPIKSDALLVGSATMPHPSVTWSKSTARLTCWPLRMVVSALLLASLLVASTCASPPADAQPYIRGVNQSRIMWMTHEERADILSDIAEHKVPAVRIPMNQPFPAVLDAIELAKARHLQVLLVVSLNTPDFYPEGETKRPAPVQLGVSYHLSRIDPARFRASFSAFWRELEARELTLMGLELGNEINWTFNGDIAVHEDAPGHVYDSIHAMPEGDAFEKGLDKYIVLLRIVRELRDNSRHNRDMKLLSAGMANVRPSFAKSIKADSVDAGLTYRLLENRGLSKVIDAAAIHYYPPPPMPPRERAVLLDRILDACSQSEASGGCWMTEWGVNNTDSGCPVNDNSRVALVDETRRAFAEAARKGRLAADFYFEWSGSSPRSIWRCGSLMEGGKAALELNE